ncbi:MAG: DUF3365 domain-containing protein [Flavobacteriales bacterium]|nr:DUF3365 domain-containing protein [Flavobacteriales bacterium]
MLFNISSSRNFAKRFLDLLYSKTYITLSVLFLVGLGIILYPLGQLSKKTIEINALKSAEFYSSVLDEFRSIYTSEVINRVPDSLYVGHDYLNHDNGIPLPATLSMILGNKLGEHEGGVFAKLYSPYPFPWREGGLKNKFQKTAWETLKKDKTSVYYEFTNIGGKRYLKYAKADVLRPSCVSCHNTHPQTPKKGWETGDVRGVLEVNIPVDRLFKASNTGVSTTFFYSLFLTITILVILGIAIRRLKLANSQIEAYGKQRELSTKNILEIVDNEKNKISAHLHDHIGQILTSAKLNFEQITTLISKNDAGIKLTENMSLLLEEAYIEVKDLSYNIVSRKIIEQGLHKAILDFIARLEIIVDIKYQLLFKCDESHINPFIKSEIFAIVQEANNNIIKYALAENVNIQIIEGDNELNVTIEDDGIGFDIDSIINSTYDGLGLSNIQIRTEWLKGSFAVESQPGKGTIIIAVIPLTPDI